VAVKEEIAAGRAGTRYIPTFDLYGEAPGGAALPLPHIETVAARSSLHDWDIRPHRHKDLHQMLLIAGGGGAVTVEGRERAFAAPSLIVVPAGLVHGFRFEAGTVGLVLTIPHAFVAALGGRELPAALQEAWTATPEGESLAALQRGFEALHEELRLPRLEQRMAVAGGLALVLVAAGRLSASSASAAARPSADMALVGRFGALVDETLDRHWSVATLAAELKVTERQLTGACRRALGLSPLQLVHRQLMAEARRRLVYTDLSVGEIAFGLGFADAAYFSRFFAQREGVSPTAFREAAGVE
jgi:AraC family transcriptional activator of pobA